MGVRASFLCKEADVDWRAYAKEEWRSERSRELDSLGGNILMCYYIRASLTLSLCNLSPLYVTRTRPGPGA